MNSANKNIDFWIYFSQRECWNCGIMGPQHGNPIYQISTYSGLCCVVKSRQDFHLNIKIYWQKLRDKNKTTRLSYYLCAMVLLLLFSLWHKTNAKQNTSIFSPKCKWFPVKHSMSKQLRNQINSSPIYYVTIKDTLLIGN